MGKRGTEGAERDWKYKVTGCALLWVAEKSGHANNFMYLFSCTTQQGKQVSRCLEKLAS